jgi:hypothetical protein
MMLKLSTNGKKILDMINYFKMHKMQLRLLFTEVFYSTFISLNIISAG